MFRKSLSNAILITQHILFLKSRENLRTYITILHETVRVLVNFKHQIGYQYRLISALKISVIGTSAKSHIGASLTTVLTPLRLH